MGLRSMSSAATSSYHPSGPLVIRLVAARSRLRLGVAGEGGQIGRDIAPRFSQ